MQHAAWFFSLACLLPMVVVGCAQEMSISGEDVHQSHVIQGDVGIIGEDHELRILAGSDVPKISIMGDDIEVYVEAGAVIH